MDTPVLSQVPHIYVEPLKSVYCIYFCKHPACIDISKLYAPICRKYM